MTTAVRTALTFVALLAALLVAATMASTAEANGQIGVDWEVAASGTTPFRDDGADGFIGDGEDGGPGPDADGLNGPGHYIRTGDITDIKVNYNNTGGDITNGVITFDLATLGGTPATPAGSLLITQVPPQCKVGSSISPDGQTLTCLLNTVNGGVSAAITVPVKATNDFPSGNQWTGEASFTADGCEPVIDEANPDEEAEVVTVTAKPEYDLWKKVSGLRGPRPGPGPDGILGNGDDEVGIVYYVGMGVVGGNDSGYGLSTLAGPDVTFTDDISGFPAGTLLYDFGDRGPGCGVNSDTWLRHWALPSGGPGLGEVDPRIVGDSGSWTCTQTGTDIDFTVTGADWSGTTIPTQYATGATIPADQKWYIAGYVYIWVPYDAIVAGNDGDPDPPNDGDNGELRVDDTLTGFDPDDIYGNSNYGDGPTDLEPTDDRTNDRGWTATGGSGSQNKYFRSGFYGAVPTNATTYRSGDGNVMTGTNWTAYRVIGNNSAVELTNLLVCDMIDNTTYNIAPTNPTATQPGAPWSRNNVYGTAQVPTLFPAIGQGDFVVEYGTGVNGGVAGTWADAGPTEANKWDAMDQGTCADGDSADGWTTDPTTLPGGAASVTKFRLRVDNFSAVDATVPSALPPGQGLQTAVGLVALDNYNGGPNDGQDIPPGTVLANMSSSKYDQTNNGNFRQHCPNYNPATHTSVGICDRLVKVDGVVRLDKEQIEAVPGSGSLHEGGTNVRWEIQPTITGLLPTPPGSVVGDVIVEDILPVGLNWVPGSASPASITDANSVVHPVEFCVVCDGTDWTTTDSAATRGVRWVFGDQPINIVQPLLSFETEIPLETEDGAQFLNTATISSPDDGSDEDARSDQDGIKVVQAGAVAVRKQVLTPVIDETGTIEWSLDYANVGPVPSDFTDIIDILPWNGDVNGSSYNGSIDNLLVTAHTPATDAVYYTQTPSASINADAFDATNTLPSTPPAPTVWCSDDPNAVAGTPALGSAGCPTWNGTGVDGATAFRVVSGDLPAQSPLNSISVTAETDSNTAHDCYYNDFSIRVNAAVLSLPARSRPVHTLVFGGAIGDLVFDDTDRDGVYTTADSPIPGVLINLYDSSGLVIATDTTDANGRYLFQDLGFAGQYETEVDPSNFDPGGPLEFFLPTINPVSADNDVDEADDHNANLQGSGALLSGPINLSTNEPTGEDTIGNDTSQAKDEWSNQTLDFGVWKPIPSVEIQKTVEDPDNPGTFLELAEFEAGDTVTFQIEVENTGEIELDAVEVIDNDFPACDRVVPDQNAGNPGVLDIGQVYTYTCSGVITDQLNPNDAEVRGTPVDGQPIVDDEDEASALIVGFEILKEVMVDPNGPIWDDNGPAEVETGGSATFQITVTNTGTAPLVDVSVSDDSWPACSATTADLGVSATTPLLPNQTAVYTCIADPVNANTTNTATGNATTEAGTELEDEDTARVEVYGLTIDKTVEDPANPGTFIDLAQYPAGTPATFQIVVTNTGEIPLTGVEVSDSAYPQCDRNIGTLGVGAVITYTCEVDPAVATINNADVSGTTPGGTNVEDDDTAEVETGGISIEKLIKDEDGNWVDDAELPVGSDAEYQIVVTNLGSTTLTDVEVTDPLLPACDNAAIPDLTPAGTAGDSFTYTCTAPAVTDGLDNLAAVTADSGGVPVGDEDDSGRETYGLTIDKLVEDPDNPGTYIDLANYPVDATSATFQITVTNTGSVDLSNTQVTDPSYPTCTRPIGFLPSGASSTFTCTVDPLQAIVNTAQAAGDTPGGNTATDEDTAEVRTSGIEILKQIKDPATGDWVDASEFPQELPSGVDAEYQITVTNLGSVLLNNVEVSDPLLPACDNAAIPDLTPAGTPGAVFVYTCTDPAITADLDNTAGVTANDPEGGTLEDEDDADRTVYGIDIDKKVEDPGSPGDFIDLANYPADATSATFQITVTNTGTIDLTNTQVSDAQYPTCDRFIGLFPAGDTITYTCEVSPVEAVVNTAEAKGQTPDGNTASDADDAEVFTSGIEIIKLIKDPDTGDWVDSAELPPGTDAEYQITVNNLGSVPLTNVVVTDSALPACDNAAVPDLTPAGTATATFTYTCTDPAVTTGLVNIAGVEAEDPTGGSVSDDDDATRIVAGIEIDKLVEDPDNPGTFIDLATYPVDATSATFQIAVTNTGSAPLINVTVTDPQYPTCSRTLGVLAAGATTTYTCAVSPLQTVVNTAQAAGQTPEGGIVSDDDTAEVQTRGIELLKKIKDEDGNWVDAAELPAGSDAEYQITVTNLGSVPLTSVAVTDPNLAVCDSAVPDLTPAGTPGAVFVYTCTDPDPATSLTNTATVNGEGPGGEPVEDEDEADRDFVGIEVEKLVEDPDNPGTFIDVALYPADITSAVFQISVTNTGTVDLANVEVADPNYPVCAQTIGALAAGDTTTYTCTVDPIEAKVNVAQATGETPGGGTVTDDDDAKIGTVGFDILKEVMSDPNGPVWSDPGPAEVPVGGSATFRITVTNTGTSPIVDASVTDSAWPACSATAADLGVSATTPLAAGASVVYTCVIDPVTDNTTNTATGNATTEEGVELEDADDARVEVYGLTIEKKVEDPNTPGTYIDLAQIPAGTPATFQIVVTNTGQVDLTDVEVADNSYTQCNRTIGTLTAGDSTTYTCVVDPAFATINSADVSGETPGGTNVQDDDTAEVETGGVSIEKLIKNEDGDFVDNAELPVGSDAEYQIVVTNLGSTTLTGVTVTDPLLPACDNAAVPDLNPAGDPGDSFTYTCTAPAVTDGLDNLAAVSADSNGTPVSDEDDSTRETYGITIDKLVEDPDSPGDFIDLATYPHDATDATFQITVTNIGSADLSNVAVTDASYPTCTQPIGFLPAGAANTFTCTVSPVGPLVNTAQASGTTPDGNTASDEDAAEVQTRGVEVSKKIKDADGNWVDAAELPVGSDAEYQITVTNLGSVPLTNVAVSDAALPACDAAVPDLTPAGTPGAVHVYTCTDPDPGTSLTNTASVTGEGPGGEPVEDEDEADRDFTGIEVEKLVEDPANPGTFIDVAMYPDDATSAVFQIAVTNTGTVDLANVVVNDPNYPVCAQTVGILLAGDTTTYTCSVSPISARVNVAQAVGETPGGGTVTDDDDATIGIVGMELVKDVLDPATGQWGQSAPIVNGGTSRFRFTITNTGSVDLANVQVTDNTYPNCSSATIGVAIPTIAPGDSFSYECNVEVTGTRTNFADATGEGPNGEPIEDSDTAEVTALNPGLEITKEVRDPKTNIWLDADAAGPTVANGGVVQYRITVRNTGDVGLTNVVVADPKVPACDRTIGSLAVGANQSYECAVAGVTAGFTNTASATGGVPGLPGGTVSDSDPAAVKIAPPPPPPPPSKAKLTITKKSNKAAVKAGALITWTVRVKNVGPATAKDVVVQDVIPSGFVMVRSRQLVNGKWRPLSFALRGGRVVWEFPTLKKGKAIAIQVTMRPGRSIKGKRTNTATANADNASGVRAKSGVTIKGKASTILPAVTG